MTQLTNTLDGGTDTVTVTVANSGGASGNAFDRVDDPSGFTRIYSAVTPYQDGLCMRMAAGAAGFVTAAWTTSLGSPVDSFTRFFFRPTAIPASANDSFLYAETGVASQAFKINLNTDGRMVLLNASNGIVQSTTNPVATAGSWMRIEVKIHCDTTAGYATVRIYTTPEAAVGAFTEELNANGSTTWAMTNGSSGLTNTFFLAGIVSANWPAAGQFVDFDALVAGASDWVGPIPAAGTVNTIFRGGRGSAW